MGEKHRSWQRTTSLQQAELHCHEPSITPGDLISLRALLSTGATLCSSIPCFSWLLYLQGLWVWISPPCIPVQYGKFELGGVTVHLQQWKRFCSWSDLGSTWQSPRAQHRAVNSAARTGRKCNTGDKALTFLLHHHPLQHDLKKTKTQTHPQRKKGLKTTSPTKTKPCPVQIRTYCLQVKLFTPIASSPLQCLHSILAQCQCLQVSLTQMLPKLN